MARVYLPLCPNAQEPFHLWYAAPSYPQPDIRLKIVIGIDRDTLADDPGLGNKRNELITIAAKRLAETKMIIFDETTRTLQSTDLGRIAAKYYIRTASIEIFNKEFRPKMSEADLLGMLSLSTEVCCLSSPA
jgi:hypothetical protein